MAKKSSSPDKTGRRLDPEDAALWDRVIETARPLSRGRNRVFRDGGAPAPPDDPKPGAAQPAKPKRPASPPAAEKPRPSSPPPLGQYDRREARRLAAGRTGIDARIDLHGLRQREAHRALNAFLASAQARGHRHVLVITGKGGPRARPDAESFTGEPMGGPGVLRRAVPRWLDSPELRPIVVGFAQAAPRHGGEGAFYVRLRKAGK